MKDLIKGNFSFRCRIVDGTESHLHSWIYDLRIERHTASRLVKPSSVKHAVSLWLQA